MALHLLVMCFPSFHMWIRATSTVKFVSHFTCGLFSQPFITFHKIQASICDSILPGTPKRVFSGVVERQEHSFSKYHVEATNFCTKERLQVATVCTLVRKDEGRKEIHVFNYFINVLDPFN